MSYSIFSPELKITINAILCLTITGLYIIIHNHNRGLFCMSMRDR